MSNMPTPACPTAAVTIPAPTSPAPKTCARASCNVNPSTKGKEIQTPCCDESCIVEVARRQCADECHDAATTGSCSERGAQGAAETSAKQQQPCANHYIRTLDRYGKVLESLGCICKVLLSLGIESCCVIHSDDARSRGVMKRGICKREVGRYGSAREKNSHSIEADKKALFEKCGDGCCDDSGSEVSSEAFDREIKLDCAAKGCCDASETSERRTSIETAKEKGCSGGCCSEKAHEVVVIEKKTCCSKPPAQKKRTSQDCCSEMTERRLTTEKKSCCSENTLVKPETEKKSCCSGKLSQNSTAGCSSTMDNDQKIACCQKSVRSSHFLANSTQKDTCQKGCCASDISVTCASSSDATSEKIAPALPSVPETSNEADLDIQDIEEKDFDVERGHNEAEHLVLSVQGMTCTGCERKLSRSLGSVPRISNIKTSLLLGQAEFDFWASSAVNSTKIIADIERMTGFKCTILKDSGESVDLIIDDSMGNYKEDPPVGVKEIAFIKKNIIRVTYNPSTVGLRDLLEDSFFQRTRLAPLAPQASIASGRAHVRYMFLITLLSAILTVPVLVLAWAPLPDHPILYGSVSLGLATIIQTVVAAQFYIGAFKALIFSRMIEVDMLIVLSTTTAYVYSVVAFACMVVGEPLTIGEFFETSTLLVTLILVGRFVSALARQQATETISIQSLQQPLALLVDPKTHQEEEIDARLLSYNDIFKVLPETSIVTDGIIIEGETEVDESMITGEAIPVAKKPGMSVVAGSVNHSGTILVRLIHLPSENTIHQISVMVDKAKALKPRVQEIADRVAGYFVPLILSFTLLIFVIWIAVGKSRLHQSTSAAAINAMTYAISALIVSCPCAIGLAVPLVVVIASGVAAKYGIIFKTAETISNARKVSQVVFDKTGTLTQGELCVVSETAFRGIDPDTVVGLIMGLTSNSKHPVAAAVSAYLKHAYRMVQPITLSNPVSLPGAGIQATWISGLVRGGNPHWLNLASHPAVEPLFSRRLTTFCVVLEDEPLAIFGLKDQLRSDAIQVINELKDKNVNISIVSGDNEAAVQEVAVQLNIPMENVRARCRPEDKAAYIRNLFATNPGEKIISKFSLKPKTKNSEPVILFCGDGTNDAPALAEASIGLHISHNSSSSPTSSIAITAADAVLMRPSLTSIPKLMAISEAFHRRVVLNFVWAFVYNVVAVLLAAGVGSNGKGDSVRIPPQFAGLGEIVSVLPVVAVAVGLRWTKF